MSQTALIIASVFGALFGLVIILFIAGYFIFSYIIKRKPYSDFGIPRHWTEKRLAINAKRKPAMEEYKRTEKESLEIKSFDNLTLRAKLWRVENSNKLIICIHGYSSHPAREFSNIAPYLHGLGYNLLFLNDRAHGDSDGKYVGFSVLDRKDLSLWIDKAVELFGENSSIFLYGISMGAATVMLVSGTQIPSAVKGAICDSGFTSPWLVLKKMIKSEAHLPCFPFLYIVNIYSKIFAKYSFKDTNTLVALKSAEIPFVFFHGSEDATVSVDMAKQNYAACKSEKELHIVEGAEHVGAYYHDKTMYENSIKSFLEKWA
ncbi:MAG TPA: alpha/beta hydrolase [Clostridia bacterium]|nr:alpha/beta hydrolase [Clostridia bacterium]